MISGVFGEGIFVTFMSLMYGALKTLGIAYTEKLKFIGFKILNVCTCLV